MIEPERSRRQGNSTKQVEVSLSLVQVQETLQMRLQVTLGYTR